MEMSILTRLILIQKIFRLPKNLLRILSLPQNVRKEEHQCLLLKRLRAAMLWTLGVKRLKFMTFQDTHQAESCYFSRKIEFFLQEMRSIITYGFRFRTLSLTESALRQLMMFSFWKKRQITSFTDTPEILMISHLCAV